MEDIDPTLYSLVKSNVTLNAPPDILTIVFCVLILVFCSLFSLQRYTLHEWNFWEWLNYSKRTEELEEKKRLLRMEHLKQEEYRRKRLELRQKLTLLVKERKEKEEMMKLQEEKHKLAALKESQRRQYEEEQREKAEQMLKSTVQTLEEKDKELHKAQQKLESAATKEKDIKRKELEIKKKEMILEAEKVMILSVKEMEIKKAFEVNNAPLPENKKTIKKKNKKKSRFPLKPTINTVTPEPISEIASQNDTCLEASEDEEKDLLLLASISQKLCPIASKSNTDVLQEKITKLESQVSTKDQELKSLSDDYECKLKEMKSLFEKDKNVLLDTNRVMAITLTNTQNALKDSRDDAWVEKTVQSRVDAEILSCKTLYQSLESEYISKIKKLQEQVFTIQSINHDKKCKISFLETTLNTLQELENRSTSLYKLELEKVNTLTDKLESEGKHRQELEKAFASKEKLYESEKDILQTTINHLLEQVKLLEKQNLKHSRDSDSEEKSKETLKIVELNEALEQAKIENIQEMRIWQSKVSELKAKIQNISTKFEVEKCNSENQIKTLLEENAELKVQVHHIQTSSKEETEHFQYQLKSMNETLALLSKRIVETESQLAQSCFKNELSMPTYEFINPDSIDAVKSFYLEKLNYAYDQIHHLEHRLSQLTTSNAEMKVERLYKEGNHSRGSSSASTLNFEDMEDDLSLLYLSSLNAGTKAEKIASEDKFYSLLKKSFVLKMKSSPSSPGLSLTPKSI